MDCHATVERTLSSADLQNHTRGRGDLQSDLSCSMSPTYLISTTTLAISCIATRNSVDTMRQMNDLCNCMSAVVGAILAYLPVVCSTDAIV